MSPKFCSMNYSLKVDEYNKQVQGTVCLTSRILCEERQRSTVSAVGLSAMPNPANLNRVGRWANEEQPIISGTQAQFLSSLKSLHIADARLCEAM